ncbi:MAG: hypothetical protein ABI923_13545 [bacterium]
MMKKKMRLALIAIALMLTLIVGPGTRSSVRAGEESDPQLEGSWVEDITVVSGFNAGTSLKSLSTYAKGGGETALPVPVTPPLTSSPSHGTWIHKRGHKFADTILSFVYDPTGQLIATVKIHRVLTISEGGDEYNGNASLDTFDPFGNLIPGFSACSTIHGRRINVEPPSGCP